MPRFALQIEYDGAPFHGWQRQADHPSVQGAIEQALCKLEPGPHTIAAAGRTDKGVHGLAQIAHCDMKRDWTPFRLSEALNYHLKPNPVSVVNCAQVPDTFHARFSATERQYLFRIMPRRAPLTHTRGYVWQVKQPLDVDLMMEGASHLLGEHDFTTFRSTICQAMSPIKTLDRLDITNVETDHGTEVHFDVRARSFLHNQVRSFVGTLERVGCGSLTPDDVKTALAARDRAACGPVSPPHGLYLAKVLYDTPPFG
ncbi:tRNA pseudouridine(38-40) synthase TruA [Sulfitobacter donghicola]|uniref:tRNA pseudouridine synthase A n=1 Tax=Sulfitobacter donghicola DSW-25 = KCTC 12864 = JCM 14565 TaxID=1300350 RepID=A0A073IFC8_9RHOB|nr:tRNA pseudouridine(38-40) synthase TruA [Sulfitobacter donghicola]KEJ88206.1 tRNA pseudouridine synthase A [Sulfitobacter donghicola DSW-25 = KCTC 12864 = JCM 14565]KIN68799.1 tRNA pseudouridine synthase A [Sulfitobacter donghicola DSW-25 = KCTC 12864 = JCM 14565]